MTALARKLKARGHDVVFVSILDTEPYVRAAQLPLIPYCEKELPLGSVRLERVQLSKLQGQAALEFTIRVVASALEAFFKNLPQTLLEAGVDALVLDQVDTGLGLVPMHLGIPYVHISNALHLDYSGNTPLCTFDWPHETTPEALARNQAGVRGFTQALEPVTSVAGRLCSAGRIEYRLERSSRYYVRTGMVHADAKGVRFRESSLAFPASLCGPIS
jgi:zeaxanthin glucosyltransferase